MNNIDAGILMPPGDQIPAMLTQMAPARNDMAVVEPYAAPILPPPPNAAYQPINEGERMEIDVNIAIQLPNEGDAPIIDANLSVEEQELDHPVERNTGWIDYKIAYPTN